MYGRDHFTSVSFQWTYAMNWATRWVRSNSLLISSVASWAYRFTVLPDALPLHGPKTAAIVINTNLDLSVQNIWPLMISNMFSHIVCYLKPVISESTSRFHIDSIMIMRWLLNTKMLHGIYTYGFLWSRWWVKRSRHYRRMHDPQLYVSGKRPMGFIVFCHVVVMPSVFVDLLFKQGCFISLQDCPMPEGHGWNRPVPKYHIAFR